MPNVNNPHGLFPLMQDFDGGPSATRNFVKPASVATAIFIHDPVCTVTGGKIQPGRATAFVGVALDYGAASTLTEHLLVCSPEAIYEAQDNASTDGLVEADMGKNANISTAVAGSAVTRRSGAQIDEASVNTTNSLDLMLLGLLADPDNAFGPNARIEVKFNRHFLLAGRTGV